VQLYFRGEKMAKVMGSLAMQKPVEGMPVSGILVKRNFNYHILAPADLPKYTDLTMSTVTQVSESLSVLPTLSRTFRPFFWKNRQNSAADFSSMLDFFGPFNLRYRGPTPELS
jgi:hypothetical protein